MTASLMLLINVLLKMILILLFPRELAISVCRCRSVTESQIQKAARNGVKTLKDLRDLMGITSECDRCAKSARQCLRETHGTNIGGRLKVIAA